MWFNGYRVMAGKCLTLPLTSSNPAVRKKIAWFSSSDSQQCLHTFFPYISVDPLLPVILS